jgi:hypothetical protein
MDEHSDGNAFSGVSSVTAHSNMIDHANPNGTFFQIRPKKKKIQIGPLFPDWINCATLDHNY